MHLSIRRQGHCFPGDYELLEKGALAMTQKQEGGHEGQSSLRFGAVGNTA